MLCVIYTPVLFDRREVPMEVKPLLSSIRSSARILITGTGSLASHICFALATSSDRAVDAHVFGRTLSPAAKIATIANARSRAVGRKVRFFPGELDWRSSHSLVDALSTIDPTLIIHTASLQSPWEASQHSSAWTDLLSKGGFGLTLALQAALLLRLLDAIELCEHRPALINACYPDTLNPLMMHCGGNVLCGLGNVATLAALIGDATHSDELRVVAHHLHLSRRSLQSMPANAPMYTWTPSAGWATFDGDIDALALLPGSHLNQITGCAAVRLIDAVLGERATHVHAPGPSGLPGGYPIVAANLKVELDLPAGLTQTEAIEANQSAARAEGVSIEPDGTVRFHGRTQDSLRRHSPVLSQGFHASDLATVVTSFTDLQTRLRGQSP
jgi:hypothetical protein